jgi:hypothetical protein
MNGFFGGTNVPNVDWLISPSFDLTATTFPILSFYSRTAFNGQPLELKVSTDYVSGDPANATWADVNGKFPNLASNVWTLSSGINLSAFKGSNVHFAFVYTSTADDGARWTLDDISLDNSATPPPPSLTVAATDLNFSYAAAGTSADRTVTFTGNDLVEDVTLAATGSFQLSKDGNSFSNAITYTVSEANNIATQVFLRFSPAANGQDYAGTLTISTSDLTSEVNLKGTSIDPATTLEVVNWNIEWFGSTEFGPTNEAQQEQNIKKILINTGADIYGLTEVVDEAKLKSVVDAMPGYSYIISNFGSHTNTSLNPVSALAEAQKLAFVYKTSVFSNISSQALLSAGINSPADLTNPAYNYWSSGRFPYMMTADVTLNCVTKKVRFVLVHAKANTNPTATSYARRKNGADSLNYLLDSLYSDDNIVVLGDFNDDLDKSITAGFTTTSWSAFVDDVADYESLTLPLSLAGKKSTVSYNDMIDHVVVSTEMEQFYMPATATVLSDVTSLVSNYGSTTTDHYPVFTRYRFDQPTTPPTVSVCPTDTAFCQNTTGDYSIRQFSAAPFCGSVINYSYVVTGATERSGTTNDASGSFNTGTSVITWTATDEFGNTASCSTSVVVNTNPVVTIPDAMALSSGVLANTVYIGYTPASSITLNALASGGQPSYTYNWSSGSTVASAIVSPLVNTTYTVIATDANGCQAYASKLIKVLDIRAGKKLTDVSVCHKGISIDVKPGSVADHLNHGDMLGKCGAQVFVQRPDLPVIADTKAMSIVAYPNPATNAFTLSFKTNNSSSIVSLKVYDLLGRIVERKENLRVNQNLQVGKNYQPGIYFAEVAAGTEKVIVKLVKQ